MQTSCGSPCYAAPELVISEGLYVGSAVDIWSCGVILYAMLAGYLPFDDDPANPDGDNINLLYKYIVNTPLSFPDYVSPEARDLLGMMLVPDPTRRADLRAIMQHSWLQPFANVFDRGVEDLEHSAMEQHQLKRLAYQRQMKQAAAAAANEPSHKMTRTQSARTDPFNNSTSSPTARSHSQRNPPHVQPEYLYETSALEQTMNSPPVIPPDSRRGYSGTVIPSTSSPLDDDPFAPPSSSQDFSLSSIPIHVSSIDEKSPRQKKSGRENAPAVTIDVAPAKTPDTKKKGGFRHTIQVEYGDPEPQEALPPPSKSPVPKPVPIARKQVPDADVVPAEERTTKRTRTVSHGSPASKRRPSGDDSASIKPLPQAPSLERSRPERATPPPRLADGSLAAAQKLPPTVSIAAATPASPFPGEREKSIQSHIKRGTGSTGSRSSKHSGTHRRGLSVDKLGFGKIFGSGSGPAGTEQIGSNGISSRVPSESSTAESGSKHSVDPTAESDTSMLSPTEPTAIKKSRRNTLTVMVEPFKTIKGRKAKTPVATEAPAQEKSRTPLSAVQASSTPASNNSKTELGVGMGIPASTNKANKVMQWFRSRSKGSGDPPNFTEGPPANDLLVSDIEQEQVAPATPTQASYRAPARSSTTTVNQDKPISSDRSHRAPGVTKRTASTATDHSFSPQTTGLANIVRTSFGIGATPAKGVLRIHHGAVDHSTVTTKPPPEVMKHVKEVLEGMGIDIRPESEFKYRCIRLKRRKGVNGVGLGLRDGGNGNGLAAFNMVGSAASNGVSCFSIPS